MTSMQIVLPFHLQIIAYNGLLMCKVIQLCLVACINKTTLFSFLSSLLREKWQIFIKK